MPELNTCRPEQDALMQLYGQCYRLDIGAAPPSMGVPYALLRKHQMVGVAAATVTRDDYPALWVALRTVQKMRQHAAAGLQARLVFAAPSGMYVHKLVFDPVRPVIEFDIRMGTLVNSQGEQYLAPVVDFPLAGMARFANASGALLV